MASSATCSLLRFSCDSCQALAMVRFMSSSPSWYICFIRLIRLELGSSSLPVLGVLGLRLRGEGEVWKEVGKYLYILKGLGHDISRRFVTKFKRIVRGPSFR